MNIQHYTAQLDSDTNTLLQLAHACPPQRFSEKTNSGWNAAEILEHILLTEKLVHTLIHKPSDALPGKEELVGAEKLKVAMVEKRARVIPAPSMLQPKGILKDAAAFETQFLSQRDALKQDLYHGNIRFDNGTHKHPLIGDMTTADWLHFNLYHTQRHIEQLRDLLEALA